MAIVIGQAPQATARSGNQLTYTFSSDQTNQPNFYYKVEVYKDAVLQSEHRVYPENGTWGKFDISEIAEYELSKPNIPASTYVDAGNYSDFYIIVREYYGTPPSEGSNASTFQSLVFKSKQSIFENFNFSEYYPSPSGGKLLTYFNETVLYPNELFYLYALRLPSDPYMHLDYRNSSGMTHFANDIGLATYDVLGVKIDYDFIESNYGGIGWNDTDHVIVTITNGTDFYDDYKIYIKHETLCVKPTRVHWLNRLGGMDSFSFTRPSREKQKTSVRVFETSNSQWFGTFYGIEDDDTGNATFNTDNDKIITLNSGAVSQEEQKIIYDNLFTSPYILIEWEERLIRVSRDSVTVDYKQDKLDQVFYVQLTVNIENFVSMTV